MKAKISQYKKMNILIFDLKSEAVKERHWKTIMSKIRLKRSNLSDVNLGMLWDADLLKHEKFLHEVLSQA
jgi:dynein heavy chain 1